MLTSNNLTIISTIQQQSEKVIHAMCDEIKGVTNINLLDSIFLKYIEKVIAALPAELIDEVNTLTAGEEPVRLCKQPRSPLYGIIIDELSELRLKLLEAEFSSCKKGEFKNFVEFLEAEDSHLPWFDPSDEMWCNRLTEEEEIALKARFETLGRLQDYLDGDTEI